MLIFFNLYLYIRTTATRAIFFRNLDPILELTTDLVLEYETLFTEIVFYNVRLLFKRFSICRSGLFYTFRQVNKRSWPTKNALRLLIEELRGKTTKQGHFFSTINSYISDPTLFYPGLKYAPLPKEFSRAE